MNRLARATSPYLRQHEQNPVDWYEWGDEAFARARETDRPIFLSVGYSTCHWCHVMAHESFESPEIAALLNTHFVPIKVDREERPDVDRVYMAFVQATTGGGGWPMSVWLTPTLLPFYGGTYFPPSGRWGRPGFTDILEELARAWREDRERVEASAASAVSYLRQLGTNPSASEIPAVDALQRTVEQSLAALDRRHGGFGGAPKFPRPSELLFLLREHARTGVAEPLEAVTRTLDAMARGGIRDHLGGGFHRYAVDAAWRVPHFEKMLYDQAQLVLAYLEAHDVLVTADDATSRARAADYLAVAEDTLHYVARDMTSAAGGFFSAEDADSIPAAQAGREGAHATEGAWYLWSRDELASLLGDDAALVAEYFGILPGGNAPTDPHGEFAGQNILYVATPVETLAEAHGRAPQDVAAALDGARMAMWAARNHRPRPHLDDKVITAWNGLMIAAFARAAVTPQATRADEWRTRAVRAASFLAETMWDAKSGTLRRVWRDDRIGGDGFAEDYAASAYGLLALLQADPDPRWLSLASAVVREQHARFLDVTHGGWVSTSGDDPSVVLRLKDDYDGAEPTAASLTILTLLQLAELDADPQHLMLAEQALRSLAGKLADAGRTVPMVSAALSAWHAMRGHLVIVGDEGPDRDALVQVARGRYRPWLFTLALTAAQRDALAASCPWMSSMQTVAGRVAAYLCQNYTCAAPVTSAGALAVLLNQG